MFEVNTNYLKLKGSYLFAEIARRVQNYADEHPGADIIRLGIGDVTKPLVPAVIDAIREATDEMADSRTFRGYGPDLGYGFLRDPIAKYDYQALGADIHPDEIFVSDGAKCDTGNIQEILSPESVIAVTDPVYPVYVDTNVMAGRSGSWNEEKDEYDGIVYLPCTDENHFVPEIPDMHIDVVYLCSPNNPTGTALTRDELQKWVDWARSEGTLILFDAAYEHFITQADVPHTIYEMKGSEECAIEFRSFSKTAGFTGTRCAFTVVPKALMGSDGNGGKVSMYDLWTRRHTTKFNGVSYIVQRGAAAVYTPEGMQQVDSVIREYLENARIILDGLAQIGIRAWGGVNSPYVWLKTPDGMKSWDFFDKLLYEVQVVGTPGSGFGRCGEGYFRLTAFNTKENTEAAIARMEALNLA